MVSYSKPFMVSYSKLFMVLYSKPFMASYSKPFMVSFSKSFMGSYSKPFMVSYSKPFMVLYSKPFMVSFSKPFMVSYSNPFMVSSSKPFKTYSLLTGPLFLLSYLSLLFLLPRWSPIVGTKSRLTHSCTLTSPRCVFQWFSRNHTPTQRPICCCPPTLFFGGLARFEMGHKTVGSLQLLLICMSPLHSAKKSWPGVTQKNTQKLNGAKRWEYRSDNVFSGIMLPFLWVYNLRYEVYKLNKLYIY